MALKQVGLGGLELGERISLRGCEKTLRCVERSGLEARLRSRQRTLGSSGRVGCEPDGSIKDTYSIDLREHYNKVSGESNGPYGLSPIQLPISPDDHYMLVVGTFTGNVLEIDMKTNKIVKSFPCGPGCHGINFGAKKGGGYLGYVSVKFANVAWVIDGDPNSDGDLSDARLAGGMITSGAATKINDDTPSAQFGQGGQGVWAYPEVYNGWVQELPDEWKAQLTCAQLSPSYKAVC